MRWRIRVCILIFFMLVSNIVCVAYADSGINSKLTVFLSGEIIEKIQVSLDFENDDPIIFVVPCSIKNYNIEYDDKDFLFGFKSYKDYSLCVVAPVGEASHFIIDILNEHNEVYEGITLKGTVTNGEYEMYLSIPVKERELQLEHYMYQFSMYSVMQVYQYSSITYSEDGRKVLIEELPGEELLLPTPSENIDSIVYTYSMDHTTQEESSPAFIILTTASIPVLICVFQLLYPDENKKKIFSIRNVILYVIVLGLGGYSVYLSLTEDVPKWVFGTILLVFISCLICIIRPIISSVIKREGEVSEPEVTNEEPVVESPPASEQEIVDQSNTK